MSKVGHFVKSNRNFLTPRKNIGGVTSGKRDTSTQPVAMPQMKSSIITLNGIQMGNTQKTSIISL